MTLDEGERVGGGGRCRAGGRGPSVRRGGLFSQARRPPR